MARNKKTYDNEYKAQAIILKISAIISADSVIARVQEQGGVATKMEGKAGILETEIKLDAARGGNVEAKQEELAEVQQKAAQAQSAQMTTLADANKELEAAAKADRQTEKTIPFYKEI